MLNAKVATIALLFVVGGASFAAAQGRPEQSLQQVTHQQLIQGRSVYVAPNSATDASSYAAALQTEGNGSNH